jgi:adenylate cyclase
VCRGRHHAPEDDAEHAWHAVNTAVTMQEALARLNAAWHAEGRPPLAMGIAVHMGEAFAGTIGARRKKKYAVIGDTVNTVSRIKSLNRDLGTSILVSATTAAAVQGQVHLRNRGSVMVKGKTQAVVLFELLPTQLDRQP